LQKNYEATLEKQQRGQRGRSLKILQINKSREVYGAHRLIFQN